MIYHDLPLKIDDFRAASNQVTGRVFGKASERWPPNVAIGFHLGSTEDRKVENLNHTLW